MGRPALHFWSTSLVRDGTPRLALGLRLRAVTSSAFTEGGGGWGQGIHCLEKMQMKREGPAVKLLCR